MVGGVTEDLCLARVSLLPCAHSQCPLSLCADNTAAMQPVSVPRHCGGVDNGGLGRVHPGECLSECCSTLCPSPGYPVQGRPLRNSLWGHSTGQRVPELHPWCSQAERRHLVHHRRLLQLQL